jgi:cellulose biosynthesis protein BcsQ
MTVGELETLWNEEESFITDFADARERTPADDFHELLKKPRSIHFMLKPVEDGTDSLPFLPPPKKLSENLGLIAGRLTVHRFEDQISSRWGDAFRSLPFAIRTITAVNDICKKYAENENYDYILIDTSPSLGALNRTIISTVDGFIVPCSPDMFSLYGIKNIGSSLTHWQSDFRTLFTLIEQSQRSLFPDKFVQFLGFTIYNAKKYGNRNPWSLAQAHYNYAKKIPDTIKLYINEDTRSSLDDDKVEEPIGGLSVMHTHNTLPTLAQKYRCPLWKVPDMELESKDKTTVVPNAPKYRGTKDSYISFASALLSRVNGL